MISDKELKVGMKVKLKSKEELLSMGYEYDDFGDLKPGKGVYVVSDMFPYLGTTATIETYDSYGFRLVECPRWVWSNSQISTSNTIEKVFEHQEKTYTEAEMKRIRAEAFSQGYDSGYKKAMEIMQ